MHKNLFVGLVLLLIFNNVSLLAQSSPKRELRAAWIASVVNIDWPSKKGLTSHEQQQEYVKLLDHLHSLGMNAVVVQVRPVADAFYPSSYEPWSEYLSGTQGVPPSPYYNPLTFMIEETRKRGMEFHAWFNPYRASMNEDFIHSKDHPINMNPEWFVKYGGKWYYDPGHPGAQEFVLLSIMETIKHYDLDAVHFDDYFYPYKIANEEFPDSSSYAEYGKEAFANIDDWRRNNVDYFVEELSKRIKLEKPHVKFGISPFGVWRNKSNDPLGSDTRAGVTNYDDLYADILKWLKEGWIDYVTPQLYWHIGFELADYEVLTEWWSKNTFGKHLYIGQGIYRVGGKGWEDPDEIVNQINLNRTYKNIHGSMFFSSKTFLQDKNGVNAKIKKLYSNKALIPTMPWIDDTAPAAPILREVGGNQGDGVKLEWTDALPGESAYYVVYRFDENETTEIANPENILAIVPRTPYATQKWTDKTTDKRTEYSYLITAVDRLHNESIPGNIEKIKTRGKRGEVKNL